jgi:hypothetical protein
MPVTDMESSRQSDPSIYDPFYMPDPKTTQVAQQAARSGQKEVFDTSMVTGLLKSVRQGTMVDRFLPDLVKALDKLGRILMLFFWRQEEFEDRYGKNEMPELEDSLRNSFEALGDITLYLKERQVGGGVDALGGSDTEGEPNIEELSRT